MTSLTLDTQNRFLCLFIERPIPLCLRCSLRCWPPGRLLGSVRRGRTSALPVIPSCLPECTEGRLKDGLARWGLLGRRRGLKWRPSDCRYLLVNWPSHPWGKGPFVQSTGQGCCSCRTTSLASAGRCPNGHRSDVLLRCPAHTSP